MIDAVGNLPDLLLAVAPRVGRVQLELVDVTINDLQLETEFRAVFLGSHCKPPNVLYLETGLFTFS
jgi:hypothetical protein